MTEAISNIGANIGNQISSTAGDLVNTKPSGAFGQFGNNKFVNGAQGFLNSNTLVAKVVFLLLVLIVFIMLLRFMAHALHVLFSPSGSPVLVDGIITGKKRVDIEQDPNLPQSKPLLRSNNEDGGIEFTYSTWLLINEDNFHSFKPGEMKHIFHKGSESIQTPAQPLNSPGLYLDGTTNKLHILMSVFKNPSETIEVSDIPLEKWFHVIIRLENRFVYVYINGSIVARHELSSVPRQNDGKLYVNMNGGFSGNLSGLRYYNYSLTTTEIQRLVSDGPNMKSNDTLNIFPPYLSMRWFLGHSTS